MKLFIVNLLPTFTLFYMLINESICQSLKYVTESDTVNKFVLELSEFIDDYKTKPYTKFYHAYRKFGICTLSQMGRQMVCKMILKDERYGYQFDESEISKISCERIDVHVKENERGPVIVKEIIGYKCPVPTRTEEISIVRPNKPKVRLYSSVLYHISIGNLSSMVLLYYRFIGDVDTHKVDIAITKFPLEEIQEMQNAWRMETYYRQPHVHQGYVESLSRVYIESQFVMRSPYIPELKIYNFVTDIKSNMSAYNKFRSTYNAVNICYASVKLKLDLCKQAFENVAYGFIMEPESEILTPCQQRMISLEIIGIQTPMAVVGCLLRKNNSKNLYYMSTIGRPDEFIAHMQFQPHSEILPDAVVQRPEVKPPSNILVENLSSLTLPSE